MCKIRTKCKKHGILPWLKNAWMCSHCRRLFSLAEISLYSHGEECPGCGKVLMPIPWAISRPFTLMPGCEKCLEESLAEKKKPDFPTSAATFFSKLPFVSGEALALSIKGCRSKN